jgi:SAM-dependent methyltransferase
VARNEFDRLLDDWARRVRENREQVDRVREAPDGPDFYGPIAQAFRADPRRTGEPALDQVLSLVVPGETWLDIGAGGGRYALPIALQAGRVVALDPSAGMLGVLREGMAEHAITNIDIIEGRWPYEPAPATNVALISHVGYDIEAIGPFLEAMETSARRLCVAVLLDRPPASAFSRYFEAAHGEPRVALPAAPDFLRLLLARGRMFEVRLSTRASMTFDDPEAMVRMARRQTWTAEGSAKDLRMQEAIRQSLTRQSDGRYTSAGGDARVCVMSWEPR